MNTTEITANLTEEMNSVAEAYIADLKRKLEEKLAFINTVVPLLEKYKKNNELFTVWRLGTDLYGADYDHHDESNVLRGNQYSQCMTWTMQLTYLITDLTDRGYIEVVDNFCSHSCPHVYRVK
jgi:hypothetical protein